MNPTDRWIIAVVVVIIMAVVLMVASFERQKATVCPGYERTTVGSLCRDEATRLAAPLDRCNVCPELAR